LKNRLFIKGNFMKKIVMATLFMAATGLASAQVTLSGKVSEFVDSSKVGGAKSNQMVTAPTSNIAVSVTEKLSGGLTARAVVETSLSGNTIDGVGTKLGDRQGTVGLSSKLGSIDLGRNVHSHFLAITNNDQFGTLYGSVAGDVHHLRNLRLGDAMFVNVTPFKGLAVAFERSQVAVGQDATVIAGSTSLFGVNATVAQFEQGTEKSTVVGLNTTVLGNKVTYTHSDDQGLVNSKGDLVGVSRAFGAVTAKASYGTTNTDVKAYSVGADYNFSKRTAVTVAYRNVNKTGSAHDVEQIGVGLTHRF
jgi:predicted porin